MASDTIARRWSARAATIAGFALLWYVAAARFESFFFPGPVETARTFLQLLTIPDNHRQILISAGRVYAALAAALTLGAVIGILPTYSRAAHYVVGTVLHPLLQAVPSVSWALLALVWFGLEPVTPVFILVTVLIPDAIVNVFEGVKELDDDLVELGRSFTDSAAAIFRRVHFPLLYPYLFSALRRMHATAWKVILVAEIFAATNGIGHKIRIASRYYHVAEIMAWTLLIVLVNVAFEYGIFEYVDRTTMRRWRTDAGG